MRSGDLVLLLVVTMWTVLIIIVVIVVIIVGILITITVYVAHAREIRPHPASRAFQPHLAPLLQVVHAAPCEKDDACGRVAFILLKVQVQAQSDDADELEKMNVEVVWLGAVRLPEEIGVWVPQLGDGAAWFGRRNGPRGESANFTEIGWRWIEIGKGGGLRGRGKGFFVFDIFFVVVVVFDALFVVVQAYEMVVFTLVVDVWLVLAFHVVDVMVAIVWVRGWGYMVRVAPAAE